MNNNVDMAYEIERLLNFGFQKGMLKSHDMIPTRNALFDLLKVKEPCENATWYDINENLATAYDILQKLLDGCAEIGLIEENTLTHRDLMDAKIMGLLMPRASEVVDEFYRLYERSPETATDYFYKLSRDSNYIQVDRINKNLYWLTNTEFGDLEITVNLSKPEKDSREIALAKSMPQTSYPKCVLCADNAGFAGNMNQSARQNLRMIPISLNEEGWYMQYSPYVYYNEHCIVLRGEHIPMLVDSRTIRRLLDFVDIMPHYFIGSNAGLPIVGGSILSHDHYQGGHHVFPMETAKVDFRVKHYNFDDVKISVLKWPMSVIRCASKNKEKVFDAAVYIMTKWDKYTDESVGVFAFTDDKPHNAVTPIARKNAKGEYEIDIVLRNNLTSDEHPLGIFHPHANLHHIKKENIGLIEVMGLAVLPGRLQTEVTEIQAILTSKKPFDRKPYENSNHPLNKHLHWIDKLVIMYGTALSEDEAVKTLKNEIGLIFLEVLKDAGVFKTDINGKNAFIRFLTSCKFEMCN